MPYDLKPLRAPRSSGALIRFLAMLAESPGTGAVLSRKFFSDLGIDGMREAAVEEALPVSHHLAAGSMPMEGTIDLSALSGPPTDKPVFETAADFRHAYREGSATPIEVAERVLSSVRDQEALDPPMRIVIAQNSEDLQRQAEESSKRYRSGKPLSPLDGVPVAVKDELDQIPFPTKVGTRFLGTEPALADASVVARLRAAGALLIGKVNMHELGLGVTGLNPHNGSARNPYAPLRATGGSSSGSAAAVASGLCPIAVGADGGGSIRIPASLCGVVGLKPTFGRVSEHGAAPLCWSLAHVGPLAASVADCALSYAVMAGVDPLDPNTGHQPAPTVHGWDEPGLKGVRLGIYPAWFEDAETDVVASCREVLATLEGEGAEVVELEIPDLGLLRTVHLVTIISEMATSQLPHYRDHRKQYGADTRLNLALARRLRNTDYVHAQRHRVRLKAHFAAALDRVDAIITPATGRTAPVLPPSALKTGESNLELTDQIMRFAPAANLTGLPAISFPAGYDGEGLPIGIQAMGRAWGEHLLLRIAAVTERAVVRKAPVVHQRLLEG